MPRTAFHLTPEDREQLTYVAKAITTVERERTRAKILLLADEGLNSCEIGDRLHVVPDMAMRWMRRYENRAPGASLLTVIRAKEIKGKRDISEEARHWIREIAGPKETRGTIQSVLERVHAEAEEAGFPRLKTVSWNSICLILREKDS